jgi:hypothetical protein
VGGGLLCVCGFCVFPPAGVLRCVFTISLPTLFVVFFFLSVSRAFRGRL